MASCTDPGVRTPVRTTPRRLLAAALAIFAATSCSGGATPRAAPAPPLSRAQSDRLVRTMDSLTRAGYVPGLEVVVDVRGRLQSYVSGDARRSPRRRLTSSQRFYIGSVTKPFIATLVLQLVAADRLRLDDTVEQLLPGVLDTGNRITVADLLSHRSGLPDVVNDPRYHHVYRQVPVTGFSDPAQIVALVQHARLDFEPGSSAWYSNTGFEVLGMIVEKITGRPLADVLQTRIFGPLHLSSASLALGALPGHPLIHGYTDDQAVWRDVTRSRPLPAYAAGYVAMDGPDLARFLDALFGRRLVGSAQLRAMRTVRSKSMPTGAGPVDYGYGLIRDHLHCGYAYGHSGRLPGYLTEAWTLPRQHRTVVVFANRADRNGGGAPVGPLIEETLCPWSCRRRRHGRPPANVAAVLHVGSTRSAQLGWRASPARGTGVIG